METDIAIPKPKIKSRTPDLARLQDGLNAGLSPIVAKILASRPLSSALPVLQALSPRLTHLTNPSAMKDIDVAANRIAQAILQGECIGIETDHDCDGQTSHAVLYYNLVYRFLHPKHKIRSYIGHRLTEGYGLSLPVANRIIQDDPKPSVIITADNGSSDEPRIALLKANQIDVIVTDHHEIPAEGCPKSALACLNPTRPDCEFGDPYIAGCMVAWLLMTKTRQKLIEEGYLPENTASLHDSLDFVAVGTVADCVSMARSINNRAVVSYGLRLMEQNTKPCWQALKRIFPNPLQSEDLAFRIGPLLNSDGRLSTAFGSVSLLLSETESEAQNWIAALQQHNEQRKIIQRDLVQQSIEIAKKQIQQGCFALIIYLEEGHTGVQGIAASRIKELFGRPTIIFAKKLGSDSLITGSVRGPDNFHVREALQYVCNEDPTLLLAFGGHQGAGGLTLKLENLSKFQLLFERATRAKLHNEAELHPIILTEGLLDIKELNLTLIKELAILEPMGREFESPIFEFIGVIEELHSVGDGTHIRVTLKSDAKTITGIWFSARQHKEKALPVLKGMRVKVAFIPRENIFKNKAKFDMHIVYLHEI